MPLHALKTDEEKREFARDVTSFANADGGDLLFGVQEAVDANGKKLGYPSAAPGLEGFSLDEAKLRIENILRDTVSPRLPAVEPWIVPGFDNGPVLILRVARSWIGPHMVGGANRSPFLSRHSAGKYPMDVHEIRSAFLAQTSAADRVLRFRDSRLETILSGRSPILLDDGGGAGYIVIHGVPIGRVEPFDLRAIAKANLLETYGGGGWDRRFNAEGYICAPNVSGGHTDQYTQAFRDGSFEDLSTPAAKDNEIFPGRIEAKIVNRAEMFAKLLRGAGYRGPIVLLVTLTSVGGAHLWMSQEHFRRNRQTIHVDTLMLPDIALDDSAPISAQLRPAFDVLWQAGGEEESPSYASGTWKDPTR